MDIHLGAFYIGIIIGVLVAYISIKLGGERFRWPERWFNVFFIFVGVIVVLLFIDGYVTPISYAIVI
jgi:hypothetical protein